MSGFPPTLRTGKTLLAVLSIALLEAALICGSAKLFGLWGPPFLPTLAAFVVVNPFWFHEMMDERSVPGGFKEVKDKYRVTMRTQPTAPRLPKTWRGAAFATLILISNAVGAGWAGALLLAGMISLSDGPVNMLVFWVAIACFEFVLRLAEWLWKAKLPLIGMTYRDQRDYMVKQIRRFEPLWYPSHWDQPVS